MPGSMTSSTTRSTPGCSAFVEPAVALMGRFHAKAFTAQEFAEEGGEFGVVIDQQDVHGSNLPRGAPRVTYAPLPIRAATVKRREMFVAHVFAVVGRADQGADR